MLYLNSSLPAPSSKTTTVVSELPVNAPLRSSVPEATCISPVLPKTPARARSPPGPTLIVPALVMEPCPLPSFEKRLAAPVTSTVRSGPNTSGPPSTWMTVPAPSTASSPGPGTPCGDQLAA